MNQYVVRLVDEENMVIRTIMEAENFDNLIHMIKFYADNFLRGKLVVLEINRVTK